MYVIHYVLGTVLTQVGINSYQQCTLDKSIKDKWYYLQLKFIYSCSHPSDIYVGEAIHTLLACTHTDKILVSLDDNYNTTSVKLGCVADIMIAPGSTWGTLFQFNCNLSLHCMLGDREQYHDTGGCWETLCNGRQLGCHKTCLYVSAEWTLNESLRTGSL